MLRINGPTVNSTNLALVTLSQLKQYMSLSTDVGADDTLMQMVLDSVHRTIFRMTGERFFVDLTDTPDLESEYDYLLDGRGGYVLKLPQWPILTITSVAIGYVDGTDPDADWSVTYTFTDQDYYKNADTGRLHGVRRGFPRGYNSIRVKWSAGYPAVPSDLKEAALQYAAVAFKRAKQDRWDQLSIGKEAETTVYMQRAMTPDVRRIVQDYSAIGMGLA